MLLSDNRPFKQGWHHNKIVRNTRGPKIRTFGNNFLIGVVIAEILKAIVLIIICFFWRIKISACIPHENVFRKSRHVQMKIPGPRANTLLFGPCQREQADGADVRSYAK